MNKFHQYRQNAQLHNIPTKTQKMEYLKEYTAGVFVMIMIFGPLFYYIYKNG